MVLTLLLFQQEKTISELTSSSIFSIYESQQTKIKNHLII